MIYAISSFWPDTHRIAFVGVEQTEQQAREACIHGTQEQGKCMKIVRQEVGAKSGDVVAFYRNGQEVSFGDTIRPS